MSKAIRADFGAYLMVGQYEALRRVRRRIKGLRISQLWGITILGQHPEGLRLFEVQKKVPTLGTSTIFQKLNYAVNGGFVERDGLKYRLTDSGRQAYDILKDETATLLSEFTAEILAEVRKRV